MAYNQYIWKLAKWDRYNCILLMVASVLFIIKGWLPVIVLSALISFSFLFIIGNDELKSLKPYGGWANLVTAIRFTIILLVALFYRFLSNTEIALFLASTIPLDGLDGYLARKKREVTNIGAYFDMETDVLYVCIVSCILFLRGLSDYIVLVAGFIRYFYIFLLFILRLNYIKEKRTKIGPVIAVYVFLALTLSLAATNNIRRFLVYSSVLMLLISFLYSFRLIWKERNIDIKLKD